MSLTVASDDATTTEPAIVVADLRRSFVAGRRAKQRVTTAVAGISFSVQPGERLAFIGPNGAGKSTSIKMLTGILRPTGGEARVLGYVPWEERRQLVAHIGTLFGQRSQLWNELPTRSSLQMLGAIHGMDDCAITRRTAELGEVLAAGDLFDQPVRTLSLGQRMRCELAASLLHGPKLLFLDEPTIGLDLVAKQRFRQLLVELNEQLGTTVFLTSHDVADIEHVADRVIVITNGVIIYDATVGQMRSRLLATKSLEIGLERPGDAQRVLAVMDPFGEPTRPSPLVVRLTINSATHPAAEVVSAVLAAGPVADLSIVDPPLEEVIGQIYGGEQ